MSLLILVVDDEADVEVLFPPAVPARPPRWPLYNGFRPICLNGAPAHR